MKRLLWLELEDPFPPTSQAFADPNGLLCAGADLSPARLLDAYTHGIFPWYSPGEPILWWSPAPRCVIYPEQFHVSRSLQKRLRKTDYSIRINTAFAEVMQACASAGTRAEKGSWITQAMLDAYCEMHALGWAHSLEVWRDKELVGGVYGLAIGKVFFGESMFSRETDASKIALFHLCQALRKLDFNLLDCQVENPHLLSLGACNISRPVFQQALQTHCVPATPLSTTDLQQALEACTA